MGEFVFLCDFWLFKFLTQSFYDFIMGDEDKESPLFLKLKYSWVIAPNKQKALKSLPIIVGCKSYSQPQNFRYPFPIKKLLQGV